MTKWSHDTVASWRRRVQVECKRLALLINDGAITGPDIADRLEQLVVKAAERKPETQHV